MTVISSIYGQAVDQVSGHVAILPHPDLDAEFIAAEASDFNWEARQNERHLGRYESQDCEDIELERIAIIGWLDGRWFVATAIVDGDGQAHHLVGLVRFTSAWDAEEAFACRR